MFFSQFSTFDLFFVCIVLYMHYIYILDILYNWLIFDRTLIVVWLFSTWFILISDPFLFHHFLLIYKEDRHAALTARSAVNATWRVVLSLARATFSCRIRGTKTWRWLRRRADKGVRRSCRAWTRVTLSTHYVMDLRAAQHFVARRWLELCVVACGSTT